jgi:hypothetical protein
MKYIFRKPSSLKKIRKYSKKNSKNIQKILKKKLKKDLKKIRKKLKKKFYIKFNNYIITLYLIPFIVISGILKIFFSLINL